MKIDLYRTKNFTFKIGYVLIDLNYIFPMRPSEFKISIPVESYDEKTA